MEKLVKLGLIADVHAQYEPLKIALDFLFGKGVEQILCAGDLVEKGRDGDRVVRLFQEHNIRCVLGNHDQLARSNQHWLRENADPNHPNLKGRILSEETLAYLDALPSTFEYPYADKKILLTHGAPWHNETYVFPFSQREVYERIRSTSQSDVVILGHTHQPMRVEYQGMIVVNPGSTCPEGSCTCAILTLPEAELDVYSLKTLRPVACEQVILK